MILTRGTEVTVNGKPGYVWVRAMANGQDEVFCTINARGYVWVDHSLVKPA